MHQRQDVFVSISQHKPTRTSQSDTRLWDPGDPSDIFTWTRRSQRLAGETADFCFGDASSPAASSSSRDREVRYQELRQDLAEWSQQTSPTFQPLSFVQRDSDAGRVFPEIRFALNTCSELY